MYYVVRGDRIVAQTSSILLARTKTLPGDRVLRDLLRGDARVTAAEILDRFDSKLESSGFRGALPHASTGELD